MAKGLDLTTIGLLAGGGYLAYAFYKGDWPFAAAPATTTPTTSSNYVPSTTPTTKPPASTTPPAPTDASCAASGLILQNGACVKPPPPGPAVGAQMTDPAGNTLQWSGSTWTLIKAAPNPKPYSGTPGICTQPDYYNASGVCVDPFSGQPVAGVPARTPTAPPPTTISQKMVAAAGTSSLNMDEWCYYYTQVTGNDCPVDPGDPSLYPNGGDRSTAIDINTWLSIMQGQAPELGLSGLGDDTPNLGPLATVAAIAALFMIGGKL